MKRNVIAAALFSAMATVTAFSAAGASFETQYEAKSVMVNNGYRSTEKYANYDQYYQLIGKSSDGYQIWALDFTPAHDKAYDYGKWKINGGDYISTNVDTFDENCCYSLSSNYGGTVVNRYRSMINVCNGTKSGARFCHFMKPLSPTTAKFMVYRVGTEYSNFNFAIDTYVRMATASTTYDVAGMKHIIKVAWQFDNVNESVIDNVAICAQMEGIVSPKEFVTYGKCSGVTEVEVPWYIKNVTITAKVTPKDCYKVLFPGGIDSDKLTYNLIADGLDCSVSVDDLRGGYDNDYGTYNPDVVWTCTSGYEDAISNVSIDYSVDNGATWKQGLVSNKGAGSGKIYGVRPGYPKYIFRYNGVAKTWMDTDDAINILAYDTIEVSYSPMIHRLEIVGNLTDNYDEQTNTFNPTLGYILNKDLQETSIDKATMECSIDGGAYQTIATSLTDGYGTLPVAVDASGKSYKFRITVNSFINGEFITVSKESDTYQRFTGVDSIAADDNLAVDVYTLDGRLVARQMLPSEAKTQLSPGTYIVGGQKMVINR